MLVRFLQALGQGALFDAGDAGSESKDLLPMLSRLFEAVSLWSDGRASEMRDDASPGRPASASASAAAGDRREGSTASAGKRSSGTDSGVHPSLAVDGDVPEGEQPTYLFRIEGPPSYDYPAWVVELQETEVTLCSIDQRGQPPCPGAKPQCHGPVNRAAKLADQKCVADPLIDCINCGAVRLWIDRLIWKNLVEPFAKLGGFAPPFAINFEHRDLRAPCVPNGLVRFERANRHMGEIDPLVIEETPNFAHIGAGRVAVEFDCGHNRSPFC